MRLISLSAFRQMAEIGESSDDPVLVAMIEWISSQMERAMDRTLKKGAYTELVQPEGSIVRVKAYPIDVGVTPVLTDYGASVSSTVYQVDAAKGRFIRTIGSWGNYGYPTLSLAYTGGYAEVGVKEEQCLAVPDDIKSACFFQTSYYWRNRANLGTNNVTVAGSAISLAPVDWLPMVLEVIRNNKRWAI